MKTEFGAIGEKNLPPHNVFLAYGLFQTENIQGPKDSAGTFDLSQLPKRM